MSTSAPPNSGGNGQSGTTATATPPTEAPPVTTPPNATPATTTPATAPPPNTSAATSEVEAAPEVAPMENRRVRLIAIVFAIVLVALFLVGILPRLKLQRQLASQAKTATAALPIVAVSRAVTPTTPNTLLLPGTMEALHEAAVYARASGYVRRWYADLGSPVSAGQVLADIDVPELQQSVLQARAQLAQMQSVLALARSNLERWRLLFADSAVTAQEYQQMEQAYQAAAASVRAAEANLRGLIAMLQYTQVRAPFGGIVTARNVEYGALISAAGASSDPLTAGGSQSASATSVSAGSLYRVAQTDTMRVYITVPQPYVASIRAGLPADLVVANLGNRSFRGTVVRTAGAVDPNTRTLLAEVDVPNPGRVLLPGMYVQVHMTVQRVDAPLVIPSTALVTRISGPQVMEMTPTANGRATVHLRSVQVARDYGSTLEILSGLTDGALVATIGSQILAEGQTVRIVTAASDSTAAKPATTAKAAK